MNSWFEVFPSFHLQKKQRKEIYKALKDCNLRGKRFKTRQDAEAAEIKFAANTGITVTTVEECADWII